VKLSEYIGSGIVVLLSCQFHSPGGSTCSGHGTRFDTPGTTSEHNCILTNMIKLSGEEFFLNLHRTVENKISEHSVIAERLQFTL